MIILEVLLVKYILKSKESESFVSMILIGFVPEMFHLTVSLLNSINQIMNLFILFEHNAEFVVLVEILNQIIDG